MRCNDCGGTLVVRGTPDEPDIKCYHCDPRGPVDKAPLPNPVYFRTAHIEVKVDRNWLTSYGEYDLDKYAWESIQDDIEVAIRRIYGNDRKKFPAVPQLEWDGWDGEPEEME